MIPVTSLAKKTVIPSHSMPIVSLENLLKSGASSRLDKVVQTAKDTEALTATLKKRLESELAESLVAATVRDNELVLLASSSAWAARLRFESDELLKAANASGAAASSCRVRVAR